MSILLDRTTPVIVQGFTGRIGGFHAEEMIAYGTNLVGGVTPGKGGASHLGLPVFDSVKAAVAEKDATASVIFVPPPFAADAIMEAADAGIEVCIAITDGIPAHDMIQVKRYMRRYKKDSRMRLFGPNCAGVISPGKAMMGIMPGHIYLPGNVGVVSRSVCWRHSISSCISLCRNRMPRFPPRATVGSDPRSIPSLAVKSLIGRPCRPR